VYTSCLFSQNSLTELYIFTNKQMLSLSLIYETVGLVPQDL
jgi:hypothetical protein